MVDENLEVKKNYGKSKFFISLVLALVSPLLTIDLFYLVTGGKLYFGLATIPQLVYQTILHNDPAGGLIGFLTLIPALIIYTLIFFFILSKINPDFSKKKNWIIIIAIILIVAVIASPLATSFNQKYRLAKEQNKCTDKDYSQLGDLKLTLGSAPQFGATEDICLLAFADADNDKSFCNAIEIANFKQFCLTMMEAPQGSRKFNFPKEFCQEYTNQEMKDKCYFALASRLSDNLQDALDACAQVSTLPFTSETYTRRDDCYAAVSRTIGNTNESVCNLVNPTQKEFCLQDVITRKQLLQNQ